MPSGWNPGAGTAAITPTLAYGKYGSPNNAMVVLVLPTGRTSAYRLSRERSLLERQDVAVLANEVRASDRRSPRRHIGAECSCGPATGARTIARCPPSR